MRTYDVMATCPSDGCPLKPFKKVRAPHGYTLALHGCRFCNFDHVVVVAGDSTGRTRLVAQWSIDSASGVYILAKEYGPNPPTWLELTCSALPQRK
jgi:hypothetical protein